MYMYSQRVVQARDKLDRKTLSFESNYAFLFLGYKQELYLWDIVVLTRKAVLSLIGVSLGHDPRSQVNLYNPVRSINSNK